MFYRLILFVSIVFLYSCAPTKNYNPAKKYAPETLQKDFKILQNILEAKHPAIYWYTPKEKMDEYFEK